MVKLLGFFFFLSNKEGGGKKKEAAWIFIFLVEIKLYGIDKHSRSLSLSPLAVARARASC
jgi:hypothetical protein